MGESKQHVIGFKTEITRSGICLADIDFKMNKWLEGNPGVVALSTSLAHCGKENGIDVFYALVTYSKGKLEENITEPLTLELEDWSKEEWETLCKLFGADTSWCARINVYVDKVELFREQS